MNVLGTQRVNRAALPKWRAQGSGLLVWIGSSSTRGGCPPFLVLYFAAKAAMDATSVSYAAEVIPFGIDTAIEVPGAFATGRQPLRQRRSPRRHPLRGGLRPASPTPVGDLDKRLARSSLRTPR
ncbi:SDR family NAD(P)-dependent oxidoreductase [Streptomyces sp. NPDC003635]